MLRLCPGVTEGLVWSDHGNNQEHRAALRQNKNLQLNLILVVLLLYSSNLSNFSHAAAWSMEEVIKFTAYLSQFTKYLFFCMYICIMHWLSSSLDLSQCTKSFFFYMHVLYISSTLNHVTRSRCCAGSWCPDSRGRGARCRHSPECCRPRVSAIVPQID